jgi:hypothetical protein
MKKVVMIILAFLIAFPIVYAAREGYQSSYDKLIAKNLEQIEDVLKEGRMKSSSARYKRQTFYGTSTRVKSRYSESIETRREKATTRSFISFNSIRDKSVKKEKQDYISLSELNTMLSDSVNTERLSPMERREKQRQAYLDARKRQIVN